MRKVSSGELDFEKVRSQRLRASIIAMVNGSLRGRGVAQVARWRRISEIIGIVLGRFCPRVEGSRYEQGFEVRRVMA